VAAVEDDIAAIYRQHGHLVLRRALYILNDAEEAQDVLQDVFASLVNRPEQFGARSSITTWLYSATVHLCLNRIRNSKNRVRLLQEQAEAVHPNQAPAQGESQAALRRLLERMPPELAQLAIHYSIEGMTHEEIATVMRCSRRHVSRLLERLQSWAEGQEKVA
jgi:RNA polymerase sigma factor (sigma-70 family)